MLVTLVSMANHCFPHGLEPPWEPILIHSNMPVVVLRLGYLGWGVRGGEGSEGVRVGSE